MDTRVVKISEDNIDLEAIAEAGAIIKGGGLVAFPTETVYGLGGDALNGASSRKIYAAKGRPSDNPLIVHIANMEALSQIARDVPKVALTLAEKYWPGPLTMIFHKTERVPTETTGGLSTVAVRMPSNKVAKALIEAAGGYIAAPSANRSGRPSPTLAAYVIEDLDGRVDMIIDGGAAQIGLESTIVDFTEEAPVILRPGYITEEMVREATGYPDHREKSGGGTKGAVDTADEPGGEPGPADAKMRPGERRDTGAEGLEGPKAPGMKYRHYAPKGSLTIVEGKEAAAVAAFIGGRIQEARSAGSTTGVIATDETAHLYLADSVKSVGKREDEAGIAKSLFRILREFDDEKIQVIYAESFDAHGVGQAIMNRLLKAAGNHVIHIEGTGGK